MKILIVRNKIKNHLPQLTLINPCTIYREIRYFAMSDFGKFDINLEANTDHVLSADDNYMLETLFKVCDIQSSGQVRVSKIITYLKQNALPDAAEVC